MKVIPLSKAKARLSYSCRLCQLAEPVIVVKGEPVFQMVPLEDDDDLINQLLEHNTKFEGYLKARCDTQPFGRGSHAATEVTS